MDFICRRNAGHVHWIYVWNFDVLHSFDVICNADDVQTWPTFIMWQGKSTHRSSFWKGRWFDSNKSAIDLRIWKECLFENTLKSDHDLFEIMTSVDVDYRLDVDLSLSYIKRLLIKLSIYCCISYHS